MIKIGEYNSVTVVSVSRDGAVVRCGNDELPVPADHCDETITTGAELKLFVYRTAGGRLIATTHRPKAVVGQFAPLRCVDCSENGAFLDWGMDKDLFVPFSQMIGQMIPGKMYVVRLLLDDVSDRVVATQKLRPFMKQPSPELLPIGKKVRVMIVENRDTGTMGIAEGGFKVFFTKTEFSSPQRYGTIVEAYVKQYDDDSRATVSRAPSMRAGWSDSEQKIITLLEEHGGTLKLSDSSSPEQISQFTGLSKKTFKKVIGGLFRQRKITIEDDRITLIR